MRILRYLVRSVNPLNVLLFIITVVAAIIVIFPLTKMNTKYSLPQVKPKPVEETQKLQEKSGNILPSDYTMIAELNLFHPERRIPVEKRTEEIPRPEVVLYGTLVQDNVQYAFIEDKKNPKTTPGRGNRQTMVKKGDIIGGFTVSEIDTDRITLTRGEDRMTVLLTSPDKRNGTSAIQRPTQTPTPLTPTQAGPGSPFGPTPGAGIPVQMGGRPTGTPPVTQSPGTAPQQLQRPTIPGSRRVAPGTTQVQ